MRFHLPGIVKAISTCEYCRTCPSSCAACDIHFLPIFLSQIQFR